MTDWPIVRLGDHVHLDVGFAFSSREFTDNTDDVRLVRGANVGQGSLDWDQERRFPVERYHEFARYQLRVGDVVLAMDRPWIAAGLKWAVVSRSDVPALLVQRVARLRGTATLAHEFVRYVIGSPEFEAYIQPIVTGVNVPHISGSQIRDFRFRLPPVEIQQEIGRLLGGFDKLVENNMRRIEILEEVAGLIYREWFVHFRFPGHEDVKFVDSDLGPIPESWKALPIGQVIETVGGGTPSKEKPDYWCEPSINWYTPSDLTKRQAMFALGSGDQINELGLKKSSAKLFPPRTVMMTSRATIGEIAIATTEASTNQGFISCVPNERLSEYHLYFWLQENVDLFLTLAGGATFRELRKSTFRHLPIIVPPIKLEAEFNEAVGPMCNLIENLWRQNEMLREARHLLLPRLISGELDVSDLDLDLAPVA